VRDINSIAGLKVISIEEGRDLGTVSQAIVDLASGALVGVIAGKGAAAKGIWADDIQVLGVDAVMIANRGLAQPLSQMPQLSEKARESSEGPVEVVTDTGKRLGALANVYLDAATLAVARYEVSGGAWRDLTEGVLELPVIPGTKHGRDTVIVPAAEIQNLAGGSGGLKAQLAQLSEKVRATSHQVAERSHEVSTDLGGRLHTALGDGGGVLRSGLQKFRGQVADVAQKARETISSYSGSREARKTFRPANPAPIEWPQSR